MKIPAARFLETARRSRAGDCALALRNLPIQHRCALNFDRSWPGGGVKTPPQPFKHEADAGFQSVERYFGYQWAGLLKANGCVLSVLANHVGYSDTSAHKWLPATQFNEFFNDRIACTN